MKKLNILALAAALVAFVPAAQAHTIGGQIFADNQDNGDGDQGNSTGPAPGTCINGSPVDPSTGLCPAN